MKINIVMVEPEIPQNTGNIARTCAATGAKLHLVEPLGFEITDKTLKRAGLDYWDKLEIENHKSFKAFLEKYKPEENSMFFVTTKGQTSYSEENYSNLDEVFLLFRKRNKRTSRRYSTKIHRKNNKNTNATNTKKLEFVKFSSNCSI